MNLIIHHNDPDGFCSAAICVRALGTKIKLEEMLQSNFNPEHTTEFFEFSYEKNAEEVVKAINNETIVFMVDVSFKMDLMQKIADKAKKFIWIDHHISAIKDFEKNPIERKNFEAFLDTKISACELTWIYFFKGKKMPAMVNLIGIYDTWRESDNNEIWPKATKAMYGIKCRKGYEDPTSLIWDEVIEDNSDFNDSFMWTGSIAKKYQDNINFETIKKTCFGGVLSVSSKDGKMTDISKYKAIFCNNTFSNSLVFDSIDMSKYDVMVSFYLNVSGTWTVSFYSQKKDIDCSKIAKSFGGGGHRGASGCQVKELPFELKGEKPKFK